MMFFLLVHLHVNPYVIAVELFLTNFTFDRRWRISMLLHVTLQGILQCKFSLALSTFDLRFWFFGFLVVPFQMLA